MDAAEKLLRLGLKVCGRGGPPPALLLERRWRACRRRAAAGAPLGQPPPLHSLVSAAGRPGAGDCARHRRVLPAGERASMARTAAARSLLLAPARLRTDGPRSLLLTPTCPHPPRRRACGTLIMPTCWRAWPLCPSPIASRCRRACRQHGVRATPHARRGATAADPHPALTAALCPAACLVLRSSVSGTTSKSWSVPRCGGLPTRLACWARCWRGARCLAARSRCGVCVGGGGGGKSERTRTARMLGVGSAERGAAAARYELPRPQASSRTHDPSR